MPKSEGQNDATIRGESPEICQCSVVCRNQGRRFAEVSFRLSRFGASGFGLPSDFGFQISDFNLCFA